MAPTTHSNTPSGVTELQVVAAVDDVPRCLSHMSWKSAKDDLVKVFCDYCHHDAITKALETTFRILLEQTGSRIRRRRSRLKAHIVSTILDLLQETPADAHSVLAHQ